MKQPAKIDVAVLMLCAIICVMAMPLKNATNASLFIFLLFFMLLLFLFVAK